MFGSAKFKVWLGIILLTSAAGLFGWTIYQTSFFQAPKLEIPDTRWEKIFFAAINQNTALAGIEKLREKHLSKEDIEIRVWEGFGLEKLESVIFQKKDDVWTAFYFEEYGTEEHPKARLKQLPNPKSGWNSYIEQITEAGLFEPPDANAINCEYPVIDGRSFVVEIYKNKTYRTYRYNELSKKICREGKQMAKISQIIADEFYNGIDQCKTTEWIPCQVRFREIEY